MAISRLLAIFALTPSLKYFPELNYICMRPDFSAKLAHLGVRAYPNLIRGEGPFKFLNAAGYEGHEVLCHGQTALNHIVALAEWTFRFFHNLLLTQTSAGAGFIGDPVES